MKTIQVIQGLTILVLLAMIVSQQRDIRNLTAANREHSEAITNIAETSMVHTRSIANLVESDKWLAVTFAAMNGTDHILNASLSALWLQANIRPGDGEQRIRRAVQEAAEMRAKAEATVTGR